MPLWRLFYHLVWSTWHRQPLLTAEIEPQVHEILRRKGNQLGATIFALNGVEDHVHLVASIPPSLSVANFVGQVKGVASAEINRNHPGGRFAWQAEYGAFSFDARRLAAHVNYVERQKEHHRAGTVVQDLEDTESPSTETAST